MPNPFIDYCDQYFDHLNATIQKPETLLKKAEKIISLTTQSLQGLKAMVIKHGFTKKDEEIHFFKNLKPRVFSQLIYYTKIKQVESTLPYFGYIKDKEKFLANELRV